ncbi:cation diffusion facilitator family transporter [Candidatus Vecturithrix granuli]|uniref:Cation diffusion facilitator family transporter n=1 Tax=Vecturithrix granuli TaxID=1499967 RepID=A0A081BU88_VECG1|nr:cation diffusion facilitator family transporter [Candidatus Vecturithrix granuli]
MAHKLDESVREVNRITIIGMLINLSLATFKVFAGWYGHSQAVLADGVHSLSDSATDIVVLVGARFWGKAPDVEHPYGHRKIEAIVTIIIGGALGLVGLGLGYSSIITLNKHHENPPALIAFVSAIISIVVKEWLYHWTIKVGKKVKSSAVIANAWHHRSDAFSSIPVAVAVAASYFLPAWSFLDHVATVAVSLFILQAAWMIVSQPIHDLSERGTDETVVKRIEELSDSVPGVQGVHKIRSRSISSVYFVDFHVQVNPHLDVEEGHNIATSVKNVVLNSDIGMIDVLIHIEPYFEKNNELG